MIERNSLVRDILLYVYEQDESIESAFASLLANCMQEVLQSEIDRRVDVELNK
jgi:hypothetical protein